jgi:putative membrane protein
MAALEVQQWARRRPRAVTVGLSVLGYAVIGAAFSGILPVPSLGEGTVDLFGHLIAIVNSVTLVTLLAGLLFIRRGQIRRHRTAMLTAFGLILLFLVLYVWKVGGGFEKSLVVNAGAPLADYAELVRGVYLSMLAIHIVLSILAVPVVLHAIVLGLTHDVGELSRTVHPRVGRIAVVAWSLSLFLGVITYYMLNHAYDSVPRESILLVVGTVKTLSPTD